MYRVFAASMSVMLLIGWPIRSEESDPADERPTLSADDDSPRNRLKQRFEANSPPLGSPLPNVLAWDADGNEFRLADLKGHYSVIVFGCLT